MHNKTFHAGRLFAAALTLSAAAGATAQQADSFGDYEIHYNAINSDLLSPKTASAYGIQRAPGNILLNVTLMRKQDNGSQTATPARITAGAVNLSGQRRDIAMREIKEQEAIYYIGQLRVRNEENLDFTINVTPKDTAGADPMEVTFRQQFYTE